MIPGSGRRAVSLGAQCSNRCFFCAQGGSDANAVRPREQVHAELEEAASNDQGVTFTGGEPGTHADLVDLVTAAKQRGVPSVGLQTNGAGIADRAAALRDAGVDDLHLTVLGPSAASHDYHTAHPGSFAQLESTLETWTDLGGDFVATTVVTRSNFRLLADIEAWLAARSARAWMIAWPHTAGWAQDNFDRTIPRLGMALPYALHAATRAKKARLPTAFAGVPLCALGPHRALAGSAPTRHFVDVCDACTLRPQCAGVDRVYLDRFGSEELRPSSELASELQWGGIDVHWRPAFVGAGPLLQRPMQPHPAPAAARRRLPVLGRPEPASAEVRKRSEAKPASDAKALFPDLYKGDD